MTRRMEGRLSRNSLRYCARVHAARAMVTVSLFPHNFRAVIRSLRSCIWSDRNMRRFRLALALPLLLVFAQQGAMLHELSHIYRTGGPQQRYEGTLLQGKLCQTCLAFEQGG